MVKCQLPKLKMRVRFTLSAYIKKEELFVPPFCYAKITIKIPFKIAR